MKKETPDYLFEKRDIAEDLIDKLNDLEWKNREQSDQRYCEYEIQRMMK